VVGGHRLKTLLLHTPKLEDFYLPFGRYMNVNYMPMGLPALAGHLNRNGHETRIVHAGVEKILDRDWRIADYVSDLDVGAVGLSLHWHYQAYDVSRAIERIKQVRPDLFVFIGGITASYFGREVLDTFPRADAVVLGEGFEPVRLLLTALENGDRLSTIPNVVRRGGGGAAIENSERMVHSPEFINSLTFADFSSLQNSDLYIRQFGFPLAYSLELTAEENRAMMTMGRSFFPLFVGSGCSRSCSYCGGNAATQRKLNATHRILWRSHEAVLNDIRRALQAGYRTMAVCFDPMPESTRYYVELFGRMKRETPEADLYFECWSLPEPEFVKAFAAAFSPPHSYLALSPDTGVEEIRKRNKGYYYTNEQLLATASHLSDGEVQMDLFFSIGFPGETSGLALKTRNLMRRMAGDFDNIRRLMVWAVQLEPGSPMFDAPERWGITTNRRTLADFVEAHRGRGDAYAVLGYSIPGFFGDKRDKGGIEEFEKHFQQFKCMEFCFHSRDPRVYNQPLLGRRECLEKRKLLALRRGRPAPEEVVCAEYTYARAVADERPSVERLEI